MQHAPLIIDVAGLALTDVDRRRLQHPLVGGMILFARNWQERAQLAALCAEVKALRSDLLICVDQEGGRVQRFRGDGFTALPSMRAIGEAWEQDSLRALDAAFACGLVMASELRACGVDFSFAPVLDLDWDRSPAIGNRALHRNPQVVAQLAGSLAHGMLSAGMKHCGKHFPGHGYARVDSHLAVPHDARALHTLLQLDIAPYRALGTALTAVIPSHVVYPRVDPRPAGFSRRWLQDILRDQLGFAGAIVSDDLSMAGARRVQDQELTATEAIIAALGAGCDLVLLCNQSLAGSTLLDEVLTELESAAGRSQWRADGAGAERRRSLFPVGEPLDWASLQRAPRYQLAQRRILEL